MGKISYHEMKSNFTLDGFIKEENEELQTTEH